LERLASRGIRQWAAEVEFSRKTDDFSPRQLTWATAFASFPEIFHQAWLEENDRDGHFEVSALPSPRYLYGGSVDSDPTSLSGCHLEMGEL
jgi:hypothetical protein